MTAGRTPRLDSAGGAEAGAGRRDSGGVAPPCVGRGARAGEQVHAGRAGGDAGAGRAAGQDFGESLTTFHEL